MSDDAGSQVLVVDDEPIVREVLTRYLSREGYRVQTAADGEDAIRAIEAGGPDLVLLDLMLPKIDGYEVLRRTRARGTTPVIMLTARGSETDRIVGLEIGADDYVTKPFSPREVVARVRAVLRRSAADSSGPAMETLGDTGAAAGGDASLGGAPPVRSYGDLVVDEGRRMASKDGRPLELTRKEFDLLAFLSARAGRTLTRAQLLDEVWDFAWHGDGATVTVHVRRLREKIEVDPSQPRHVLTVWGVGYRFEP